jgi:uncharacterized protein YukJ
MPVIHYGVLKGHAVASHAATAADAHYEIHIVDQNANMNYRIAVNVLSNVQPFNLQYHVNDNFTYKTIPDLLTLPEGFTPLSSEPDGLAIDFLRTDIVDETNMQPVHFDGTASATQLSDLLDARVQQAIADPDALVFAFGSHFGPEPHTPDSFFDFLPGNGIHDIHMNQGNDPSHSQDDGTYQDGALMLFFPSSNHWMAVFLKFQSQAIQTDDQGHALNSPAFAQDY